MVSVRAETLIDASPDAVWDACAIGTHHNGVAQVFAEGERTRFVWVSDLLPEEMADRTGELMELGSTTVKKTLEAG